MSCTSPLSIIILILILFSFTSISADTPPDNTLPIIGMRLNGIHASFGGIRLPLLCGLSQNYQTDSSAALITWDTDSDDIGAHIIEIYAPSLSVEPDPDDNSVQITFLVEPQDYATTVRGDSWDMSEGGSNPWHTDDIASVALYWDDAAWTDSVTGMLFAGESQQTDWSDGPGVSGPVTSWDSSFYSNIHTGWEDLPGSLLLAFNPVAHSITNYMGNLHCGNAADMDGDGDMDILSDSGYRALIAWFENDGSGGSWDRHDVSSYGELYHPTSSYPVDIDGDGDMDVLGTESSSIYKRIYLWINVSGSGTEWETYVIDDDLYHPHFVCSADIDGDGDPDVLACDFGPDASITWYENNLPSIDWLKHNVAFIQNGRELFPADMDLDGDIDILSACEWWDGLFCWENADSVGTTWVEHEIGINTDAVFSVCAADVDSDGKPDVVAARRDEVFSNGYISWFKDMSGALNQWDEYLIEDYFHGAIAIHAGDITGDGFIDILGAAGYKTSPPYSLYELVLWESVDGSGENWIRRLLDSESWYEDVDVADIDGDDFPDVISSASVGSIIQWIRTGYFSSGQLISSILDMTGYPEWKFISWTSIESPATNVKFQVRSSNDSENMGYWSDDILTPGSLEGIIDSTYRFVQYKAIMESSDCFTTPVLEDVTFYWDNLGIEGEDDSFFRLYPVAPNPATGNLTVCFNLPEAARVTIHVFDLSGRLVLTPVDNSECSSGLHILELPGPSEGMYILRIRTDDQTASRKFTVLN